MSKQTIYVACRNSMGEADIFPVSLNLDDYGLDEEAYADAALLAAEEAGYEPLLVFASSEEVANLERALTATTGAPENDDNASIVEKFGGPELKDGDAWVIHTAFGSIASPVAVVHTDKVRQLNKYRDADSLAIAFELTNTIDKPWYEHSSELVSISETTKQLKGARSTSVDDLVFMDNQFYQVAPFGFRELDPSEVLEVIKSAQNYLSDSGLKATPRDVKEMHLSNMRMVISIAEGLAQEPKKKVKHKL